MSDLDAIKARAKTLEGAKIVERLRATLGGGGASPIVVGDRLFLFSNGVHLLRAINILGDYGPLALAALPALTTASENPNADIKKAAIGAIARVKGQ